MMIYLLLILSLFLCQPRNAQAGNSALCLLTVRPSSEPLEFARELAQDTLQYGLEIFIMIDDNNFNAAKINASTNLQLLQIPNKKCLQHNYHKTIWLHDDRQITAWDKALLYFGVLNKNYSFVWLIEHDVFIPSTQAFRSLHELYSNTSDLVVPHNELNLLGNSSFWHWSMAVGQFVPPWSSSMVNVVGLSRRMLVAIDDYVQWLGVVPFHEYFFNTLAMQLNYTIVVPTELSTIVFSAYYHLEDTQRQSNNLWHPFKNIFVRKAWRKSLAHENFINNNPIELTNLEMLCHNNSNMTSIKQYLTDLLLKFEKSKSTFSSTNRRLLRQRFSHLAQQCQNQNATKEIVSLAMKLADHAYKLPEPPVGELVTNKSTHHLQLEQALKENKKSIIRLPPNSSIVNILPELTAALMKELKSEIQRECKAERERQNQTRSSSTSSLTSSSPITAITSRLFSSTPATVVQVNQSLYQLTTQNDNQMFDLFEDDAKRLLLITTMFCILLMLFKRKKIQRRKYFIIILILLLLLVVGILFDIT